VNKITADIREFAHALIERMPTARLQALLDLLDEDFFTEEEIAEIQANRRENDWTDWRSVRDDL
jgi:hypothetical protein